MKRKRNNTNHGNKKKKVQDTTTTTVNVIKSPFTHFEHLSNEVIYEIFDFLDIYHIYESFFDLNKRFQKLLNHSILPIKIHISSMSKLDFQRYYSTIIKPNKHRIISLHLSNLFIIDIVLSPAYILSKFLRLQTLVLDNIKTKQLKTILKYALRLPNLYSLVISHVDHFEDANNIYQQIFRLTNLKYCKISFGISSISELLPNCDNEFSSIEHFVIDNSVYFDELDRLLSYVPRLRNLSIQCLNGAYCKREELSAIKLNHLTHLTLDFHYIDFNQFERLVKDIFHQLQVLCLSTGDDIEFLNANRWEQLILFHLPYLRIFDLKHRDSMIFHKNDNQLSYDVVKHNFSSSFWIERQCFFTYHQNWRGNITIEIFYSTDSNKKKRNQSFKLKNVNSDSFYENIDFHSIHHIRICSLKALNNCVTYFPNVTDLTLEYNLDVLVGSLETHLNRIIPLIQVTKLVIDSESLWFTELLKLLYCTQNLHTLKGRFLHFIDTECEVNQQNESFRLVSSTNMIKNVTVHERCTLEKAKLLVNLFPRLEQLSIGIDRKNFESIIRILLSTNNNNAHHLFFLCLTMVPKLCIRQLKRCIKLEKLLDDYLIEYFDRSLYLWC